MVAIYAVDSTDRSVLISNSENARLMASLRPPTSERTGLDFSKLKHDILESAKNELLC